jgi:hypothetical protein
MRLAVLALAAALAAPPLTTRAETLILVCHVLKTRGDGAHRQIRRRLELDLTARKVKFFDDAGQGWKFRREGPFVSADARRIVLDAGGGKDSYVDRVTGQYVFRNSASHLSISGPCRKAAAANGESKALF